MSAAAKESRWTSRSHISDDRVSATCRIVRPKFNLANNFMWIEHYPQSSSFLPR
jgi:hypothetical protein